MTMSGYEKILGVAFSNTMSNFSRKAYEISEHELDSLREISLYLRTGRYREKSQCYEHLKYLEDTQKRFNIITLAEEREGIMNWQLREIIRKVGKLSTLLSGVAKGLPSTFMNEKVIIRQM
jgi:hypothetical protein